jgi:hypothetical protein
VSILPGAPAGGRGDPEREAAAQRRRTRFARDIGDEAGMAWAHEPRRPPRKVTVATFVALVVFAGLGAIPLITNDNPGGLLRPDCTTPAVEVGPSRVLVGESFAWQAVGPEGGPYVVTLDAGSVTGAAAGPVQAPGGQVLAGPIDMAGCRSRQQVVAVPETRGSHEVILFRRAGDGWERAAVALLRVT